MKKLVAALFAGLALLYLAYNSQIIGMWPKAPAMESTADIPKKSDLRMGGSNQAPAQKDGQKMASRAESSDANERTSPPLRTESFPKGVLPLEAALIEQNSVRVAGTAALLDSPRFSESLEVLKAQAARDWLASDLLQLYSESAMKSSTDTDGVVVHDIACGRKLCMGLFSVTDQDQMISWANGIGDDPNTPIFFFMNGKFEHENGEIEKRFIFSSDPELNGAMSSWHK